MATWHDTDSARDQWLDAPDDDEILEELLEVAKLAVVAYAPKLPPYEPEEPAEGEEPAPEQIPVNYRVAQLQHARNLRTAALVDPSGAVGEDDGGFVVRPHPLDWHVKQMLRPQRPYGRSR